MEFNSKQLSAIREYNSLRKGISQLNKAISDHYDGTKRVDDPDSLKLQRMEAIERIHSVMGDFPATLRKKTLLKRLRGARKPGCISDAIVVFEPLPDSESEGTFTSGIQVWPQSIREVSRHDFLMEARAMEDFLASGCSEFPDETYEDIHGTIVDSGLTIVGEHFDGPENEMVDATSQESVGDGAFAEEYVYGTVTCSCSHTLWLVVK